MEIALLMTGNEIMTGDTVDSNSSAIAKALSEFGFDVAYKVTIGDDLALLSEEIRRLSDRYPVVLINGGLGPTQDDLTAEAMAAACSVELEENHEAKAQVTEWCLRRQIKLTDANLKQCFMPAGGSVLLNPVGSAPGIAALRNNSWLVATPGVPSELKAMLRGSVVEHLRTKFPDARGRLIRRLKCFGVGESTVQQIVQDNADSWPPEVTLGFRAGLPLLELKLEIDDPLHLPLRDACEAKLNHWFADSMVGENDDSIAELVVKQLIEHRAKIAVAESCTGGQIAASITSVPNASQVFDAGIVSYANQVKIDLLGVDGSIIEDQGVVSEQVVLQMAHGALRRVGGTHAIAVSGIAGPGGGTEQKPVGTVCMAWGTSQNMHSVSFYFPYGRAFFQQMVSAIGLYLMRRFLLGVHDLPDFLSPGGRFAFAAKPKS